MSIKLTGWQLYSVIIWGCLIISESKVLKINNIRPYMSDQIKTEFRKQYACEVD